MVPRLEDNLPARHPGPRPPRENYQDIRRRSPVGLIIGLAVGGGVLLIALLVVLVLLVGGRLDDQQAEAISKNNLKQISLALLAYHDLNGRFPPVVVYNQTGQPLYSWRVLLLPQLDEITLYQQFHLNEPWDSPHNHALLAKMPRVYGHPLKKSATDTHYQVINGEGAVFHSDPRLTGPVRPFPMLGPGVNVFESGGPARFAAITDGSSNTILVAEAADPVPWTRPMDLPFGPGQPLPRFGGLYAGDFFLVAMADGTVRKFNRKRISDKTLHDAITANGGEFLGPDFGE
jgi:hypothetical protein